MLNYHIGTDNDWCYCFVHIESFMTIYKKASLFKSFNLRSEKRAYKF